jgi:hypothetical protein
MSSKENTRASKIDLHKEMLKDAHGKRKGNSQLLELIGSTVRNEND